MNTILSIASNISLWDFLTSPFGAPFFVLVPLRLAILMLDIVAKNHPKH